MTPQGRRLVEEGLPLVVQLNQRLVSTLSGPEQSQLKALLGKVLC